MNKKSMSVITSHKSDNWATPLEIYDLFVNRFGFFDPCPLNCNGCDALLINWRRFNFVNPPYSDLKRFIEKALLVAESGNIVILLIPFRSDTYYFKQLFDSHICSFVLITGRLNFGDSNNQAPFPSMFVILDNNNKSNNFDLINKKDIVAYFTDLIINNYKR